MVSVLFLCKYQCENILWGDRWWMNRKKKHHTLARVNYTVLNISDLFGTIMSSPAGGNQRCDSSTSGWKCCKLPAKSERSVISESHFRVMWLNDKWNVPSPSEMLALHQHIFFFWRSLKVSSKEFELESRLVWPPASDCLFCEFLIRGNCFSADFLDSEIWWENVWHHQI